MRNTFLMLEGWFTDYSGERLNGIQEVCGSIPHISTKKKDTFTGVFFLLETRKCFFDFAVFV